MITHFLLSAYQRLEICAQRKMTPQQKIGFESAISDILLLGSPEQITLVKKTINEFHNGGTSINNLLQELRRNLRKTLSLPESEIDTIIFRFGPD